MMVAAFFWAELQDVQRSVDLLAADQVRNQAALLLRQANAFEDSFGFHYCSLLRLLVSGVALERAGQGEFAELVTDHVLGHIHRHVLLAVVHGDGQTDEVRQ